jgi:hypothetical protein
VAVPVAALAARVLRHQAVAESDLLGVERAGEHLHLARVLAAEDVGRLLEATHAVMAGHRATLDEILGW